MMNRHRIGFIKSVGLLYTDIRQNARQIMMIYWRDFNAPHRRNVLGAAWAYIMPMIIVTAYIFLRAVIQSQEMTEDEYIYPVVFVCVGVTFWLLMRDMIMTPTTSAKKYKGLISGARFPVIGGVLVGFGTVMLETLIRAVVCAIAVIYFSNYTLSGLPLAFGILMLAVVFCFSVGLLLVPIILAVPDIANLFTILFRYLIFFSGAIWAVPTIFGGDYLYTFNPVSIFLVNFREALVIGKLMSPDLIVGLAIATPIIFLVAVRTFYALEPQIKEAVITG